jgi:hypothetical protein
MAYSPIAFIAPNYSDYGTYWFKAYPPGSTTPKPLSIDLTGTTTFAKLQLNVDGFFKSAGGALIMPYIDGPYDAYLFQTADEADANNTATAIRLADDITPSTLTDLESDLSQAYNFDTVSLMQSTSIIFPQGKVLNIADGSTWDVVLMSGVTLDNWEVLDTTPASTLAYKSREPRTNPVSNYEAYNQDANYYGSPLSITELGAVAFISDSFGEGTGASEYKYGYLNQVFRSIFNHLDNGPNTDRGYRYETVLNMGSQLQLNGISSTGSAVTGGVVDDRIQIVVGQNITISQREIVSADVFYDAGLSSGNITFELNGDLIATKAVSGTGIKSTFQTLLNGGTYVRESDILVIKTTGTLIVTGLLTLRTSSLSPLVYGAAKSGWGIDEFAVQARVDDLAAHINTFDSAGLKLICVMVGTNNIYNPSKDLTPDNYIIQLNSLINKYKSAMTNTSFIISVPPKPVETTWPSALGYYDEYVYKIIEYCKQNNYQMFRLDKSGLSSGIYYSDDLHPNNTGHTIEAQEVCKTLGIPWNLYRHANVTEQLGEITYNSPWTSFTNISFTIKADLQKNTIVYSGITQPNGSINPLIGTMPVGYRPVGRDAFLNVSTQSGVSQQVKIEDTGQITLQGTLTSDWISFEGVSITLDRQ